MKRPGLELIRTVSVACLVCVALQGAARADGVVIKNVPLPVTGSVNATITGTPTVNIGTMPPVNATVQEAAKTAFQAKADLTGSPPVANFDTFPPGGFVSGNRYVVQAESVNCQQISGAQILRIIFEPSIFNPADHSYYLGDFNLPFAKTGSDGTYDYYSGSASMTIFTDSAPAVAISATDTSSINCQIFVSGYSVPTP